MKKGGGKNRLPFSKLEKAFYSERNFRHSVGKRVKGIYP
jgi:hypothetical protein